MKKKTIFAAFTAAFALSALLPIAQTRAAEQYPARQSSYPIRGSFLTFHRPYPSENPSFAQVKEQWRGEFLDMKNVEMDTVVVLSIGSIKGANENYALDASTLHYLPSENILPASQRTQMNYRDELRALIELGEEYNIKIFVGLLQTKNSWFAEDLGWKKLIDTNRAIAADIYSKFGNSPALAGWYIPQEIELNYHQACNENPGQAFCNYTNSNLGIDYRGSYYGTGLVKDLANSSKTAGYQKPVMIAPIARSRQPASGGQYPALITEQNAAQTLKTFAKQTNINIIAVQDGAGSDTNQPRLYNGAIYEENFVPENSELYKYFAKFKEGVDGANAETGRNGDQAFRLYGDLELFYNNNTNLDTNFPPAGINRISDQIKALTPNTNGLIVWNYFWHMSKKAAAANPAFTAQAASLYDQYQQRYLTEYAAYTEKDTGSQIILIDQFGNKYGSGGVFASSSVAARIGTKVYIAGRDSSGAIWANQFDTISKKFAGWRNLGGIFVGDPAMDILPNGKLVFAGLDKYNSVYTAVYNYGGTAPTWNHLGGVFATTPSIAACGTNNFGVVSRDNWNGIWTWFGSESNYSNTWKFRGGVTKGNPAIACANDDTLYVTARDLYNNVWIMMSLTNDNTSWHDGKAFVSTDPQIAFSNGYAYVASLDSWGAPVYNKFQYQWGNSWFNLTGTLDKFAFLVNGKDVRLFGQNISNIWYKSSHEPWAAISSSPAVPASKNISTAAW